MRAVVIVAALAWLAGVAAPALAEDAVVDLPTRPGVTVRLLLLTPSARPRAAVVLLPGSAGVSRIPDRAGAEWTRGGSVLVRASPGFVARDVMAAIVDVPSD